MSAFKEYENCTLCPRNCHADRSRKNSGICGMSDVLTVSRASLHMWEEPIISGESGSGTVFFTGCNLHCVFCQNHEISGTVKLSDDSYREISEDKLSDIFLELESKGANNINLVTGVHFIPHIRHAIEIAKSMGLKVPVLYNSSGYESVESLKSLEGLIDIYLPDFKYIREKTARLYSKAADYPDVAKAAIAEMVRQQPSPVFLENGMLKSGVVVRHLVMPGGVNEANEILDYLYGTYKDNIYISIMNQYTPFPEFLPEDSAYDLLRRKVTKREYERVINHAFELGIENGFTQDGKAVSESFVPSFKCEGV